MKINEIYNNVSDITIESYLSKLGIIDVPNYIKPSGEYLDLPLIYNNMEEGVELLKYHYLKQSDIYVLCDSDVDGITSISILYAYLKLLNKNWNIKILLHDGKERGLADKKVFKEILSNPRPLLIIPDAGSNEVEQTRKVFENRTDVLVLDHHAIKTPIDCGVLINNQSQDCNKNLSGCGVTHKFLQALDLEFDVHYSELFIDIVALSIIADGCDIRSSENRLYLKAGLFNGTISNEFLRELIGQYVYKSSEFTIRDLSFSVIPKINSVIRSDNVEMKQRVLKAFIGIDDAKEVSELCGNYHKEQMGIVKQFITDNEDKVNKEDNVIVLCSDDLKRSYSGLISGRLSNIYNRPCIVGRPHGNEVIGSFRGKGITRQYMENCTGINWAMGHDKDAFGISLDLSKIDDLREELNTLSIDYEPYTDVLISSTITSLPIGLYGLFSGLNELWSEQFLPKPKYHIHSIKINTNDIKLLGKKGNTLKFISDGVEFIKFSSNEELRNKLHIGEGKNILISIFGELELNVYRGKETKQIIINEILEVEEIGEVNFNDIF
ncbi:MAG: DHH family phosphoesterase [Bacilli bacterium]